MILKALFDSVTYEEIEPYLIQKCKQPYDQLNAYREAYDFIMAETPTPSFIDKAWVEYHPEEEAGFQIRVCFLDGALWCHELAKEVIFEEGVEFNLPEVLASCLWEMTFFNFSEDRWLEGGDELDLEKEEQCVFHERASKALDRLLSHGYYRKQRMNRSKRKRNWRQENRYDFFQCVAKRFELCCRMKPAFPTVNFIEVMRMQSILSKDFRSTVTVGRERLPYILGHVKQYLSSENKRMDAGLVWLVEPEQNPVEPADWEAFQAELRAFLGIPITFGVIRKPMVRREIAVGITTYRR